MPEEALTQKVQSIFESLRKPNGETIKADMAKSVGMVLKSSKAFTLD